MKNIGLICLLFLALASCKKTNIAKTVTPPDTVKKTPPDTVKKTPPDTGISAKDTMLVSVLTAPGFVSRFQYDGNNRLVHQTDSGDFNLGGRVVTSSFNYDAQGNLIKRETSDIYGDTVYNITYIKGQPVSANYMATYPGTTYKATGTIKYTVTNGKVTELDGFVYPSNLKIQITYSGNNIASIGVNGTFANPLINYSYGTKKSPYAASRFKWFLFPDWLPVSEWILLRGQYPVSIYSANDLETLSSPSDPLNPVRFSNQYNASGYPIQATITGIYYDPPITVTYQYIK